MIDDALRDDGDASMWPYVDAHVHLAWIDDAAGFADECIRAGCRLWAATTTPAEFEELCGVVAAPGSEAQAGSGSGSLAGSVPGLGSGSQAGSGSGLGLHPWWVPEDAQALDRMLEDFDACIGKTPLISEVGLDFAPAHAATRDNQIRAFEHIAQVCVQAEGRGGGEADIRRTAHAGTKVTLDPRFRCDRDTRRTARAGTKVLSIHAVRSAQKALDILAATGCLEACTCVFHWFSGSSDELLRARKAGCLFSLNARMLATKRGREYARTIPLDRLLLETDAPAARGEPWSVAEEIEELEGLACAIAELRGVEAGEVTRAAAENARRILPA